MKNPFTEAEEYEYREVMRERKADRDRQMHEDAMDALEESKDD